jgi:hypothetical protein
MAKKFPASPADLKALYRPDWSEYYKQHQQAVDLWNRVVIRRLKQRRGAAYIAAAPR